MFGSRSKITLAPQSHIIGNKQAQERDKLHATFYVRSFMVPFEKDLIKFALMALASGQAYSILSFCYSFLGYEYFNLHAFVFILETTVCFGNLFCNWVARTWSESYFATWRNNFVKYVHYWENENYFKFFWSLFLFNFLSLLIESIDIA